ncbi:hypothetical protein WNY37_04675 [Henriciella sp. AS95]|uniref:hypothetical protein n=1 Tax=Henriciella sp. AS95 TaxID=3135782 RepID=UPI00317610BB
MKLHLALAGVLAGALASPAAMAANDDITNAELYASLIASHFECDALVPAAQQVESSFANWEAVDRDEIVDAFTLLAQPEHGACGSLMAYASFMSSLASSSPQVFDAELHLLKPHASNGSGPGKNGVKSEAGNGDFSNFTQSGSAPLAGSDDNTSDYRN